MNTTDENPPQMKEEVESRLHYLRGLRGEE
jgi:hypothetical protein